MLLSWHWLHLTGEKAFVATQGNKSRSLLDLGYSQLLKSNFHSQSERSMSEYRHGMADE